MPPRERKATMPSPSAKSTSIADWTPLRSQDGRRVVTPMTTRAAVRHASPSVRDTQKSVKAGALAPDAQNASYNEAERLRRLTAPLGISRRPRDFELKTPQTKNKPRHALTQHGSPKTAARATRVEQLQRLQQEIRISREEFTSVAERQRKIEEELRAQRLEESQRAEREGRGKKELRCLQAERVIAAEQRRGEARFQRLEEKVAHMEEKLDKKEARIIALESGQQCTPCKAAVMPKDGGLDMANVFAEQLPVMNLQANSLCEGAREPGTPSVRDLVKAFERTPSSFVPPQSRSALCGGVPVRR